MKAQKPTLPKGTRDFGPEVMAKRNFILNTIKAVYQKFGFLPLETPSMENLSVLTGKYGDEGDQLLFKVLNSGQYLNTKSHQVTQEDVTKGEKHLTPIIAEKGLRYDLTVPFARFVVMNQNDIAFPFKRFQIQPVWRADRPQRGRYREFYQCDADVIGTDSLLCEAEIILMINEVLAKLQITQFDIKINNRKILSGIAEYLGAQDDESDLFVAIDKLDKIGVDGVLKELNEKDFEASAIEKLRPILSPEGSLLEKINQAKVLLIDSTIGQQGINELEEVFELVQNYGLEETNIDFDITLARGLSYYTGAIFEVKVKNVSIGSISGGGRYDNLTGMFGLPDMSGIGFSFGVDRVYDVMEELELFPADTNISTEVMIVNFDKDSEKHAIGILSQLRDEEIKAEIYPSAAKMKKQMAYADKKNIPYVLLIGTDEIAAEKYTLKNMHSGEQQSVAVNEII